MLLIALLVPLLGAIPLFLQVFHKGKSRDLYIMAVTLLTSGVVAYCLFTPGAHPLMLLRLTKALTISFKLDGLGRVFGGLVGFLWPIATLYGLEYMRREGGENQFFGYYLLSYCATLGVAFAEDMMTMYIFYELLTLATLPLVMHGMHTQGVNAGHTYMIYCLGGAALGFMALVAVIHYSGSSNFCFGGIAALASAPLEIILPIFVIGFFGYGVKAAVFPVYAWLPAASVAPTPVTALLHAVAVVKAGAFSVIRLCYYCYGPELLKGTWAQTLCLSAAVATIVIGSAMAVREQHLKRRLAYSTMSNLSYVLFGALLLTPEGLQGGLMHMVYHGLMKITLFSCVGAIMLQTGRRYVQELRGLSRKMPFVCAVFLFCAVELVGIPPFVGFQSKWALAVAGLNSGAALGLLGMGALILSAILTAVYLLSPALSAYALPLEPDERLTQSRCDPGAYMKVALGLLCAVMLALAFASAPLARFLSAVSLGQL